MVTRTSSTVRSLLIALFSLGPQLAVAQQPDLAPVRYAAAPSGVPAALSSYGRLQDPLEEPAVEAVTPVQQPDGGRGSLAPLPIRELSPRVVAVNLSIEGIGTGVVPESASEERASPAVLLPDGYSRGAYAKTVYWRPSCVCHFPLYFEDAMLERHGHVRWGHLQPAAAGAKFFGTIALLPYLKTLQPGCECRYALGHYRPGSCAPPLRDHLPWDRRAAVVETLSAASFFWAAPL